MGFEVQTTGGADLASVRRQLRALADKGLGKQLGRGLRDASQGLRAEIKAEVPRAMPSGYAPTLAKSLRFRQQVRESRQTATVTLRVYGDGKRQRRDVPALNRGVLRHPTYGRRRDPWVEQRVRGGFVDRPVTRLGPEIRKSMDAVVDHIADQIKG